MMATVVVAASYNKLEVMLTANPSAHAEYADTLGEQIVNQILVKLILYIHG